MEMAVRSLSGYGQKNNKVYCVLEVTCSGEKTKNFLVMNGDDGV